MLGCWCRTDKTLASQSTITSTSRITVSGLVGFITPDSSSENTVEISPVSVNSVDGFFTDSISRPGQPNTNLARWTKSSGTLQLALLQDKVFRGGTEYVFSVRLTNPFQLQNSPSIELQSSGELSTARVPMQKAAGFAMPLYIANPTITMAQVRTEDTTPHFFCCAVPRPALVHSFTHEHFPIDHAGFCRWGKAHRERAPRTL